MYDPYADGAIPRQAVVCALAKLRSEWQETDVDNLMDVEASVGLLLSDLGVAVGLQPDEMREALGEALFHALFDVMQYA